MDRPNSFDFCSLVVMAHEGATGNGPPFALQKQEIAEGRRIELFGIAIDLASRTTGTAVSTIAAIIFEDQALYQPLRIRCKSDDRIMASAMASPLLIAASSPCKLSQHPSMRPRDDPLARHNLLLWTELGNILAQFIV